MSMRPNQEENLNRKIKFICLVQQGTLPFKFEWFLNGSKLLLENERSHPLKIEIANDESTLTIAKLAKNDTGTYSCRVQNRYGFDQQSTNLFVKGSI